MLDKRFLVKARLVINNERPKKVIPPKRSFRFVFSSGGGGCIGGSEGGGAGSEGGCEVFWFVFAGLEEGFGLEPQPQLKKESILLWTGPNGDVSRPSKFDLLSGPGHVTVLIAPALTAIRAKVCSIQ